MINSYRKMSGSNSESFLEMAPTAEETCVVVRHTFFDLIDDGLDGKETNEFQGRRRFFSDTDLIDFKLRDEDFESIATTASNVSDFSSDSEENVDEDAEGSIFIPQLDDFEQAPQQEQQQMQMMWLPVTFVTSVSGVNENCDMRQATGKRCKRSAFVAKKREERALRRAQREVEGTALAEFPPCADAERCEEVADEDVASFEGTSDPATSDSALHLVVPANMDTQGISCMMNSQGFEDLYTSVSVVSCKNPGKVVRVVMVSRKVADLCVQLLPEELKATRV